MPRTQAEMPPAQARSSDASPAKVPSASPRVGLCLGAGGARGYAHFVLLEALDAMGLRPAMLSGCSMGAVVAAPYAWGVGARDLRAHALAQLRDKPGAMARLYESRAGAGGWWSGPILVDAERLLERVWPVGAPQTFAELLIPLVVAATDFYARSAALIDSGPLRAAVAGSMAIPGLVKPVAHEGRALVDGALVEPAPYELLFDHCDVVIVCDVIGGPRPGAAMGPDRIEAMFAATQILQHAVLANKLARRPPDLLLRPPVDAFGALDFFSAPRIVRAAETELDAIKRAVEAALTAWTKRNP